MKLRHIAAALFLPLSLGLPLSAAADEWQLVLSDRDRRVEIDRASIFDSDRGTKVSWGRVVLSAEETAKAGYATVRALNRYDCMNRSFFTIKRVYLDRAGRVIREEAVTDTSPVMVTRNSVDERMWREVCRPPTVSDLEKVATAAGRSAAEAKAGTARPPATPAAAPAASAKPPEAAPEVLRHADFQPGDDAATPARDKVADAPRPTPAAVSIAPSAAGGVTPAAAPMPAARPAQRTSGPAAPVARPQVPGPAAAAAAAPRPPSGAGSTALSASARAALAAMGEPKWSYEGETGPEHWGTLRPDWRMCAEGTRQSPVDLREGLAVDLEPVRFDYRSSRFRITDTGTTLQINVGEGMGMEVRGQRYELTHLTLHRPSEERVGGQAADMSVHFHHRDAEGRQAVVAVMLERGDVASPMLQTLWNNLPLEKGAGYMPTATLDLGAFMPASPAHFLYMGSLATPPCTEGVLWVVMKTPVPVAGDQLDLFSRLYPRNTRPIQPTNGRLILESR